jgi:hypothetical protein
MRMPELHDLLERRASRYEPPPDLFDRVLDRRRRRDRNRRVGTAVVALALVAAAFAGLARALTSGPGARPADQPSSRFDQPSSRFMGEELAGVWLQTRSDVLAPGKVLTFTTDGTFVMEAADRDAYGAVDGTYQVQGDTITFTDPDWGCPLMKWTGRQLPEVPHQSPLKPAYPGGAEAVPLAVDFEFLINDTGPCTAASGFHVEWMRVAFVRISPRSPETDNWETYREFAGSGQARRAPSLQRVAGIWFQDDAEYVLRISPGGEYTIGVGEALVTDPANTGTISFGDDGTIEFTSGPESRTCVEGTVMTWRDVRVSRHGMWADVDDPCGDLRSPPGGQGGLTSWHNLIRY